MREFVVYTLMRLLLFVGSLALVVGVWSLFTERVPVLWVLVLALAISGVGSYFLLARQRAAFAARIQQRAENAAAAFEQRKAREDDPGPS